MTNQAIAKILREMGGFYEMQDMPFKPRAYAKAAFSIGDLDEQVEDIYKKDGRAGLLKIPGVGRRIAEHIEELLETGHLKKHEQMRKQFPVDLEELTSIAGIGPKTVKILYDKLQIRSIADLKRAAIKHQIRDLPGFGERSELQILTGLNFRIAGSSRFTLGQVFPIVSRLVNRLKSSDLFDKLEVGGSFTRGNKIRNSFRKRPAGRFADRKIRKLRSGFSVFYRR